MNAPARIARYAPTVDTFVPCCGEEERRLRAGVLYMRDKASSAERHSRPEAAAVLRTVAVIASEHAFAAMPIDHLRELRAALVRLMLVASALEVRGPGSPPDEAIH